MTVQIIPDRLCYNLCRQSGIGFHTTHQLCVDSTMTSQRPSGIWWLMLSCTQLWLGFIHVLEPRLRTAGQTTLSVPVCTQTTVSLAFVIPHYLVRNFLRTVSQSVPGYPAAAATPRSVSWMVRHLPQLIVKSVVQFCSLLTIVASCMQLLFHSFCAVRLGLCAHWHSSLWCRRYFSFCWNSGSCNFTHSTTLSLPLNSLQNYC